MTPTIHAIGLILYAVGAVAAGLWLVQGALALPPILAATSAGCLFVFVALAHESFVRRGDRDDILDELDGLQRTNAELTARLEEATSEIERIKKAVADGDWKAHKEVVGEIRVLQGLLHRFAGKEGPMAVQADDELEPLSDRIDRRIPEVLPDTLSNKEILGIVQKGLHENRVDLYLQPVVVLPQRKTRFMKVDAGILLSDPHQIDSPIHIEDLKEALKKSDIDLIAEEVESEQQVIGLLDLGLELAQGYLFGEPRPSRDAA
tara:strand:+ start:1135 stop:1920 length:786 start_codon:yes stop_codon:yes gene_type:complete